LNHLVKFYKYNFLFNLLEDSCLFIIVNSNLHWKDFARARFIT